MKAVVIWMFQKLFEEKLPSPQLRFHLPSAQKNLAETPEKRSRGRPRRGRGIIQSVLRRVGERGLDSSDLR